MSSAEDRTMRVVESRQYVSEIKHLFGEELMRLECLFVRCIRPNDVARPDFVQPSIVRRQLKSLNVSSSVRFQQVGFPSSKTLSIVLLGTLCSCAAKWVDAHTKRTNNTKNGVRGVRAIDRRHSFGDARTPTLSNTHSNVTMAYEREAQKQRVTSKEQTRNQGSRTTLSGGVGSALGSSRFAQEESGTPRSVRCHESVFEGGGGVRVSLQDLGKNSETRSRTIDVLLLRDNHTDSCAKVQRKKRILTNSCCSCRYSSTLQS